MVYKFQCGLCNEFYCGEYVCYLALRSGEQTGISPVSNKTEQPRKNTLQKQRPEVFIGKGVQKMCSKFTGEHPCRKYFRQCLIGYIIAGKVYKITSFFKGDFLATNLFGYRKFFNCDISKTVRVNVAVL